jgi:hypothetical protein
MVSVLLPFSPQPIQFQAIASRLSETAYGVVRIKISGCVTFTVGRNHSRRGRIRKPESLLPSDSRWQSFNRSMVFSNGETEARRRCKSFPPPSEEIVASSDAGVANHGDPHSVPLISHWGLIPRLRCCWFSAAIAVLVCPLGMHPHNWLAQQLH